MFPDQMEPGCSVLTITTTRRNLAERREASLNGFLIRASMSVVLPFRRSGEATAAG